jgi:hypothetical protein
MTDHLTNDLKASRHEAALLLRLGPDNLSPSDTLRCDLIATLRLSIDSAQADALEGRAADLGRLIVATEALVKLLPSDPPKPESREADPRQQMWEIYKQMRERGELNLKPLAPSEEYRNRIAELEGEIERLTGSKTFPPAGRSTPITPGEADIVPPGERAECDAGPRPGPDDPKPRRPGPVIEGKVNPPAAKAKHASPPSWDDSDSGRAWQAWVDAGSPGGGDRWANNN